MRPCNAAVYGRLHAWTMADNKAVPMNPMNDSIEVTDNSYAPMLSSDVQERIAGLSGKTTSTPNYGAPLAGSELVSYLNRLSRDNMKHMLVFITGRLTQCPLKP